MRRDKAIKFMRHVRFFANEFSKDPSTKVGALFLDAEDYSVLTQGYNGMPRGADESRPERQERPTKYAFYEHAERNAIYNSARPLLKNSVAITTEVPSMSCARALISVGVTEVYFPQPLVTTPELLMALALFAETNVKVGYFFAGEVVGEPTRHRRKLAQYIAYAQHLCVTLSKDPLATATVMLCPDDYTLLAEGYSGLPRGADDTRLERYIGEARALWVEGSVRNAIYNCVRHKLKHSVGLVTATTCVECARAMAAVGSQEVVYVAPSADLQTRWGGNFSTALEMLRELNVATTELSAQELEA